MSGPAEDVQVVAPRRRRLRWILSGVAALIVAAIVVPLISLGRYHRTIADSLSRGLGHTVHIGSVNLTLLPLPGLVIHDLVVEEDPAFGAEPLLRAPEVTVYPRLSSLWRERLEISRIDLDDASVNLVRDAEGRWNFSSLLLQASRTAAAPTAQRRPGPTPRFPYIGFSGARINFKEGVEKKAFSLFSTDASVWQADPNRWRIRLEAQPVRTDLDLDLEDTGTIRLDGSVTRAASLDELPLNLHAEWNGAQLGQVSRLVTGRDSGWRGDLRADADITGDMTNLVMRSRLRVANAHRVEFTPLHLLNLDARCDATYHHRAQSLDGLTCLLPTGAGHLLLTGGVPDVLHPQPDVSLEINHTPVSFVMSLLGLLRSNLTETVSADGVLNGRFAWGPAKAAAAAGKPPAEPVETLTGQVVADHVAVSVAGADHPFTFTTLRFATPVLAAKPHGRKHAAGKSGVAAKAQGAVSPHEVDLDPVSFSAGATKPMQVSGRFSRGGFLLRFSGDAALASVQPLAADFAQLAPLRGLAAKGLAQADLTFTSTWVPAIDVTTGGDLPAAIQGTVRVEHAQAQPAWIPEPIEIATATAQFSNREVTWANASIAVNGIAAKGSASYPMDCSDPAGCPAQINLDFPTLDAAALQSSLLGAGRHDEFLQAILSRVESAAPPWPALNGSIHVGTLVVGKLKLSNATASVSVRDRRLNLLSLDASSLGGTAHANGSVQAASGGPQYALDLTWTGVKLADAGGLFHENWGAGTMDGHAALKLSGYSGLAASATGDFRWTVQGRWGGAWSGSWSGTEPSLVAASAHKGRKGAPWIATGTIANQTLTFASGPAKGTITFGRKLDLDWKRDSGSVSSAPVHITGSIAHPVASSK